MDLRRCRIIRSLWCVAQPAAAAAGEPSTLTASAAQVEFPEYPNVLIRMLNNCIKEPQNHLAVFVVEREGLARLDFIQNMEYKFVELLSCNFVASPDDIVRQHICFRYNRCAHYDSEFGLRQVKQVCTNACASV